MCPWNGMEGATTTCPSNDSQTQDPKRNQRCLHPTVFPLKVSILLFPYIKISSDGRLFFILLVLFGVSNSPAVCRHIPSSRRCTANPLLAIYSVCYSFSSGRHEINRSRGSVSTETSAPAARASRKTEGFAGGHDEGCKGGRMKEPDHLHRVLSFFFLPLLNSHFAPCAVYMVRRVKNNNKTNQPMRGLWTYLWRPYGTSCVHIQ